MGVSSAIGRSARRTCPTPAGRACRDHADPVGRACVETTPTRLVDSLSRPRRPGWSSLSRPRRPGWSSLSRPRRPGNPP